jgi:hypothetical protein
MFRAFCSIEMRRSSSAIDKLDVLREEVTQRCKSLCEEEQALCAEKDKLKEQNSNGIYTPKQEPCLGVGLGLGI